MAIDEYSNGAELRSGLSGLGFYQDVISSVIDQIPGDGRAPFDVATIGQNDPVPAGAEVLVRHGAGGTAELGG